MVTNRIGVTRTDNGYELRAEFWDDLVAASERIPAGDVPLASNFDRIRTVLIAMKYTDGTANAIHRWVKENRPQEISSRHVYINANAAAVLGLARTEPPTGDRSVKRWGLTGLGAQLITTAPGSEEETQTYAEAIRGVELIQKLLVELRDRGELKRCEIKETISSETTGLSEQSISRRGSSVRNWLQRLPETQSEGPGSTLTYLSQ
ncbi:hypothetical protein HUG10_14830 [Halorarum halophilum]|uniref:Uncharacterized protein n=1 Tax=Halorarum halophilum TaxID=2743090 RepID=A0A7D5KMV6_9EURY|nr:hypothetical protein [Halobaculum halophilum]QLG28735.1 hypothetical protein HUG10_14830 [Halobaculum halophilum]